MPISLQTVFANVADEEACVLGEELCSTDGEWRALEKPRSTMPCPNGKTWGECSEEERREYEDAMWWYLMRDWIASQTKH